MAYTYEQFEREARKAGMLDKFDKQDLIIAQSNPEYGISMLQLMKNGNGSTTSEQKILADEAVRQLRQSYGGYISGGRLPEYADEAIQQTDNYYAGQNAYQKQLAVAEGYGTHDYDEKLADIYTRQNNLDRERARANALATASAGTGGVPSSYALTLAQQAKNESDAQLNEAILGLRQNAYQQALIEAANKQASDNESTSSGSQNSTGAGATTPANKNNAANQESGGQTTNKEKPVTNSGNKGGISGAIQKVIPTVESGAQKNEDATGTAQPKQTVEAKAFTIYADFSLALWEKQGLTKSQRREKLLEFLNDDGRVGQLSDAELEWIVEYYKDYNLVSQSTPQSVTARTQAVDSFVRRADSALTAWERQGMTKNQRREKLLEFLNNDDRAGHLSDAELEWIVKYYKDYNLDKQSTSDNDTGGSANQTPFRSSVSSLVTSAVKGGKSLIATMAAAVPKKTSKVAATVKSLDGSLAAWKRQGLSYTELRNKLLGSLNNNGTMGNLTDGEWAWILNYYKDYNLV